MGIKYGICQWGLPGNGGYSVKYASEAGLDGIQIELGELDNGYYMAEKKVQDDYLEDAKRYGIEYPSLVLNGLSKNGFAGDPEGPDYKIAMESLELSLPVAENMKIDVISIPQFFGNAITDERSFENSAKVLRRFCADAYERGIKITCESALSAEKQIALLGAVDMPNLYILYDSQNYYFFNEYNQKEMLDTLYPYISDQAHVKDGWGLYGKGGVLSGAMLGEGDSEFLITANTLKENQFEGWLILENYYYLKEFRALPVGQFGALERDVKYLKTLFK